MYIAIIYILGFTIFLTWQCYQLFSAKRSKKFAYPVCGKCHVFLKAGWDGSMHCHACGNDLEQPYGVYFGKNAVPNTPARQIKKTLLWIGVYYVVMACIYFLPMYGIGVPKSLAAKNLSNTKLIAKLPEHINDEWHWLELQQRYQAGKFTLEEALESVDILIDHLEDGTAEPVNLGDFSGILVGNLIVNNQLPQETALRFLQSNYQDINIRGMPEDPEKTVSFIDMKLANSMPLDLTRDDHAWAYLTKVVLAEKPDEPLDITIHLPKRKKRSLRDGPMKLDRSFRQICTPPMFLPPGRHELIFTFKLHFFSNTPMTNQPEIDLEPDYQWQQDVHVWATINEDGNIMSLTPVKPVKNRQPTELPE